MSRRKTSRCKKGGDDVDERKGMDVQVDNKIRG